MQRYCTCFVVLGLLCSAAPADPIFPEILSNDFAFLAGAGDDSVATYINNGDGTHALSIEASLPDYIGANEVFTFTQQVKPKGPTLPVWDPSDGTGFGGDLVLSLLFDNSDGDFFNGSTGERLEVNLTGAGTTDPGQLGTYDLEIWGSIGTISDPNQGRLLGMKITEASLYGNAGGSVYTLEAVGVITYSEYDPNLLQMTGAITGSLSFDGVPDLSLEFGTSIDYDVTYSGHAGVPEPITLALLSLGGVALLRRRRQ